MKVTVKDNYLNVRFGKPSVNAPCYQYIAPGSVIEVDGKLYKGDKYGDSSIDTWLKDAAENYYWSGGTTNGVIEALNADTIDYNIKSPLPPEVRATKGSNITIGIVDSGCFRHTAFQRVNINGSSFVDGTPDFKDTSTQSHGTFVAGIIAAGQCQGNKMLGIAPNVSLIISKITSNSGISDRKALLKGLQWLADQQPDIINCSFDFSPSDDLEEFEKVFQSENAKNIIWVGAGHDNEGVFNKTIYYPALEQNFIAVGSVRKEVLSAHDVSQINSKIKYLINEFQFVSTDRFGLYKSDVGSSFASAFVSGNLALIKAHLKKVNPNISPSECVAFLDVHLEKIISPLQLDQLSIFKT